MKPGFVNTIKQERDAFSLTSRRRIVGREAPLLMFPPNACRGERCGGFGERTAPIQLFRDSRRVTLASGTFSARTRGTRPRSNLLSKRSVKAGRVMMTYAEKRRRRTVSIF